MSKDDWDAVKGLIVMVAMLSALVSIIYFVWKGNDERRQHDEQFIAMHHCKVVDFKSTAFAVHRVYLCDDGNRYILSPPERK